LTLLHSCEFRSSTITPETASTISLNSPSAIAEIRTVRKLTRRVARYHDAQMALRGAAAGFLEAEKQMRKLMGHKHL
jgi:hypothetical protein